MPEQKGKKRKRPRRRGAGGGEGVSDVTPASSSAKPVRQGAARQRFQFPPWANLAFGLSLLILGILFGILPQKGFPPVERTIILLGYFALAGLYLSKAWRQYRRRQQE